MENKVDKAYWASVSAHMKIDFWYSNIIPKSGIQDLLEEIDEDVLFKNIDTDTVNTNKLNFLVFTWETKWAFPNTYYTHSDEFIRLLSRLQDKDFYFIADFSGEAHTRPDENSLLFLNKLRDNKININRIIVANNDSSKIGINKIRYESFILNTCFFPNFFLSTCNHLDNILGNQQIKNSIIPDKKFLCLNRRMFHHKYKVIEELFNRGLLEDTRFSWVDNKDKKNLFNKNLNSYLGIDINNFKSIQLEGDVMYGSDLSRHEEYLYTVNPDWYYKSKVNIITETILEGKEIHITEKTWKAIYLGIPFVIYASKNHLKILREMGFKTFNTLINEDYDEMIGDAKLKQIIDSAEELARIYNTPEVLEICRFNQKIYSDKIHRKNICKNSFLNRIVDIKNNTIKLKIF
jgi:hypothetical protein